MVRQTFASPIQVTVIDLQSQRTCITHAFTPQEFDAKKAELKEKEQARMQAIQARHRAKFSGVVREMRFLFASPSLLDLDDALQAV